MLNSATLPSRVTVLSSTYVPANEWWPYAATPDELMATNIRISSLDFMLCSPSRVLALWESAIHTLLCQSREGRVELLRAAQAFINRFDEHLRRPGRIVPIAWLILIRIARLYSLNLLESHALLDGVLNAVPNDRDHVPILEHVVLIPDSTVAGNDHGAAFL